MAVRSSPPTAPATIGKRDGRGRYKRTPEEHQRLVAWGVKHGATMRQIKLEHDNRKE